MKKLALAAVLAAVATTATAGRPGPVAVEPAVVVAQTQQSTAGIIIPLLLLVAIAAVATR